MKPSNLLFLALLIGVPLLASPPALADELPDPVDTSDEDGDDDLVIGNAEAFSNVLFNDGDGSSFTMIDFSTDQKDISIYGLDIGDANSDGILDIVTGRSGAINTLYFGGYNK